VLVDRPCCGPLGAGDDGEEEGRDGGVPSAIHGHCLGVAAKPRHAGLRGATAHCPCVVCHGRRSTATHPFDAGRAGATSCPRRDGTNCDGLGTSLPPAVTARCGRHRGRRCSCAPRSPWSTGGTWCFGHLARWTSPLLRGLDTGEAVRSPVHHVACRRCRREEAKGSTGPRRGRRRRHEYHEETTPPLFTDDVARGRGTTQCSPDEKEDSHSRHRTEAAERWGGGGRG
jgi:hypothetical protein